MKTTIDIPENLYKQVKIRAIERGQTLKQIVLDSLQKELAEPPVDKPVQSYWANRKLLPEFARLDAQGAFTPDTQDRDITDLISDDRDGQ